MSPNAKAALLRVIEDTEHRDAVEGWIASKTVCTDGTRQGHWVGKRDDNDTPVMNICTGSDPVTVPISVVRYVIDNGRLPEA